MKEFEYEGVDKNGRTVRGSTTAQSAREVKSQLVEFGFRDISIKEKDVSPGPTGEAGDEDGRVRDGREGRGAEACAGQDGSSSDCWPGEPHGGARGRVARGCQGNPRT